MAKLTIRRSKNLPVDDQILHEKSMIFQVIQAHTKKGANITELDSRIDDSKNKIFLAYEVRKHYGKIKAVEDVSLSVDRHECFGILGVNRAGKSVTFRVMAGEEVPDHGIMQLSGKSFRNHRDFFLLQIGYCPQHDFTLKCLNTYDHLRLFARLRGIPEDQVENEVQAWIDRLNLNACALLPSRVYSNGNKQRLKLAIALIGSPKLVLLDEPTVRVDPGARRSFWNIVQSCQATGQTFLLATHSMEECEALCDRMTIMVEGKLTCFGTPSELKQRFGAGYDVQIRMDPTKASAQMDDIKNSLRLLLPCVFISENSGSLLYHVFGPGTTWKKLYGVLDKLKSRYESIDDYLVIVRLST